MNLSTNLSTNRPILLLAILALVLAAGAFADDPRVEGADLVTADVKSEELHAKLLALPITNAEIELLAGSIDGVVAWAGEHPQEWGSIYAGEEDGVLARILGLGVWDDAGITGQEFVAVVTKVQIAGMLGDEITEDATKGLAREMQASIDYMEQLKETEAGEMMGVDIEPQIGFMTALRKALEDYPAANLEVLQAHRETIHAVLMKLARLSPQPEFEGGPGGPGFEEEMPGGPGFEGEGPGGPDYE